MNLIDPHHRQARALSWLLALLLALAASQQALAGPAKAGRLALGQSQQTPANTNAEDPMAAVTRLNLEVVQQFKQGRYVEALALAQQAVALAEQSFGKEHPLVAMSLNGQAEVHKAQGHYAEAEPLYRRSLAILEQSFGAENPLLAVGLNNLAALHEAQGRYTEAEPLMKKALALLEKSQGPEHPDVATSINNLAALYDTQGRLAEAESLYQRSLAIREQALGPEHADLALSLNNLAMLYHTQGRYAEAEPLFKRALAIFERALGPDHPNVATSRHNLGAFYKAQGRYAEAEPLYRSALASREKTLGPEHPDVAQSINNLALLYDAQGRYAESESLLQQALALRKKALGADHPRVAEGLHNLAAHFESQGRYAEAEPLYKQSLAVLERALGAEHAELAQSLSNLAALYKSQGRYTEAEPLQRRALAIQERALGGNHPDLAISLNNLAAILEAQRRYAEAEPLYQRALSIWEKTLGPGHPTVAIGLSNLAGLQDAQGRGAEAESLYQRALALREKALGPQHRELAESLNNLAEHYRTQGRPDEAEPLHQRALGILEQALGPAHPHVAISLNHLAQIQQARKEPAKELPLRRRALAIQAQRQQTGQMGKASRDTWERSGLYLPYLGLLSGLPSREPKDQTDALTAFQLARQSETAQAFQFLAQRLAAGGDSQLAALVRQRQDLLQRLDVAEKRLLDSYSLPAERKPQGLSEQLRAEAEALRQQEMDQSLRLQREFPAFAEFEGSRLTGIAALQQALGPREAALAWVLGEKESYLLLLRKEGPLQLHALPAGQGAIGEGVAQLHQALDLGDPNHPGQLAPFPAGRAAILFRQLFGADWQHGLKDIDHLLLVPEGPLTRLPFAVLLTEPPGLSEFPPGGPQYREAPWLARRFSLSVLPSLSAISALRVQARPAPAAQPFLGIGDPLLDDHPAKTRASAPPSQRGGKIAAPQGLNRNVRNLEQLPQQLRQASDLRQARLQLLREQPSLPDTADELHAIARLFPGHQALMLRERASEAQIKQAPLNRYNIISFATHGVLAEELGRGIEPGLVLTPPKTGTDQDDGYLSLSEVAQLQLNADWVVLSACNTAGGAGQEAEGLTGLAKAFTYAGAKALLVSHWAVSSQATVELMGQLFQGYQRQRLPGATAHQQAMLRMIDGDRPELSHPSLWAPFVVVGDGG